MKREFIIQRQGKDHVLFAGLLDAAHAAGLKSIRTRLLQAPSPENGETTICHAEVEMGDGRLFSGIGDANERNVGPNIRAHAIRMSETRAKARALRDALNIGAAALEELGGDDDDPPPPRQEQRPQPPMSAAVKAQTPLAIPADSPLRAECRDLMRRMLQLNPATKVELPPDDAPNATWSLWLDTWREKVSAVERRGNRASEPAR